MYGLPKDFDTAQLLALVLQQVCVGQFQTQLRFFGDTIVSIQATVTIDDLVGVPALDATANIVRLLGDSTVGCSAGADGTLTLTFAGGGVLHIHDSYSSYESYTINSKKGLVVV